MDRQIEGVDGRVLQVADEGDSTGPAILSFHGSGMGRTLYKPYVAAAAARGARVLAYDRPGLGGSSRRPGYLMRDCASDVRLIARSLGMRRLTVWGTSAGGPYALACAALLPDQVAAVACIAGSPPPEQRDAPERRKLLADPEESRAEFARNAERERARASSVEAMVEAYGEGLPPADARALRGGVAEWFAEDVRDALAPGGDGWFDEAWATARDWGFDVADIQVPMLVVHGRADPWLAPVHSESLAARIPGAELWLLDGEGHLSTMNRLAEVIDWLLAHH